MRTSFVEGAMDPSRAGERAVVVAAITYAAAAAVVFALGADAVSDDDFARVVIAEGFAHRPSLDPSGTSWLPAPFWAYGGAMIVLGRSLAVARLVAFAAAACSGALVTLAAMQLGLSPRRAFLAAALPLVVPLVPVLGAATVPELPVAALCVFAVAASERGCWLRGGGALFVATLSRYEAWPIAACVAVLAARRRRFGAAALAAFGPIVWIAWNAAAHGDALRFAHRVAAYHAALGGTRSSLQYVVATILLAPAHLFAAGVLRPRARRPSHLLVASAVLVAALTAGALAGGAPTHHPERTLVFVVLALSLLVASRIERFSSPLAAVAGVLAIAGAAFSIPRLEILSRADRANEIADGASLRVLVPAKRRLLLVPSSYAHLALVASFARPEDVAIVARKSFDPRENGDADPLVDEGALRLAIAAHAADFVLADHGEAASRIGEEIAVLRTGRLYRVRTVDR